MANASTAEALATTISRIVRSGALRVSAAGAGIRFRAARLGDGFPAVLTVTGGATPGPAAWQLAALLGMPPTTTKRHAFTVAIAALGALGMALTAVLALALLMTSDPSGRRSCDGALCSSTMLEALRVGAMHTIRCSGDGSSQRLTAPACSSIPRLRRSTRPDD